MLYFCLEGAVARTPDVIYDTIRVPYVQYEQAYCETNFVSRTILQNSDSCISKYSLAVSKMKGFDASITCDYATIEEEERKIYNIPDDEDYGPVYTDPPFEEEEIYEIFKGKDINTLQHKNIR